jgi:hypothetical protein
VTPIRTPRLGYPTDEATQVNPRRGEVHCSDTGVAVRADGVAIIHISNKAMVESSNNINFSDRAPTRYWPAEVAEKVATA